jgi:hypothetical protein
VSRPFSGAERFLAPSLLYLPRRVGRKGGGRGSGANPTAAEIGLLIGKLGKPAEQDAALTRAVERDTDGALLVARAEKYAGEGR